MTERGANLIHLVKKRQSDVEAEALARVLRPILNEMQFREAKIVALEEEALRKLIAVLNRELVRQ